jgi:hypothetical protein
MITSAVAKDNGEKRSSDWPVVLPWQAYLDYAVCCCRPPDDYASYLLGLLQGGREWLSERQLFCTATASVKVVGRGYGVDRDGYWRRVALARMAGRLMESEPVTPAMRHGTEKEPEAREAYERAFSVVVRTCGLVLHPDLPWIACSPDGRVEGGGMIEIKCPYSARRGGPPSVKPWHMPQVQQQIACCASPWCDYVTYDSSARRMDVIRVFRCQAYFEEMVQQLSSFGEALLRPWGPPPPACHRLSDDLVERRLIASVPCR